MSESGIALRETCRVARNRTVPLWPLHFARLTMGGCTRHALDQLEVAVAEAIAGYTGELSSRIRLTVTVAGDDSVSVNVERRLSSLDVVGGPRAAPVVVECPPELPPGAAKPADRDYWNAAQRAARAAGGDQAILVDSNGTVIDGGTASIFCRRGRELITPPAPPAVAGVARAWVLENAVTFGYECRIAAFAFASIEEADEVFFTNAFGGLREMRGRGGAASEALGQALSAVLSGSTCDFA